MRILLSNDDGIHAPGIQTLAKHLREFADVQVVAPDRNRSGASNSLTLESSLRTFAFENGDIAVQMGTPTDCVFLGVNALMRPRPDIVVSGINAGPNLGDDVIYSGTVAAAMEGRHLGFPALAVSLNGHTHYDTAAAVTCSILRALSREPLRTGRILNINVPDLPLNEIKAFASRVAEAVIRPIRSSRSRIRAATRSTGLALLAISAMRGRILTLPLWMKAMSR
ncbi:bifunctional 5'-3'-nucleotidase/exopolyphosphatase SurE [Enterobacter cloacae]|uniref:5'/3'-nucleotidase SurE n=1 Tax=Enterobacter cloacae TaxID=550 RepID=A0A377LTD3_ENTCL|nr:bifunctional 5'-3'-nucleotidase/exopolyphosphatase SurE [Enterobacter cloacae]